MRNYTVAVVMQAGDVLMRAAPAAALAAARTERNYAEGGALVMQPPRHGERQTQQPLHVSFKSGSAASSIL